MVSTRLQSLGRWSAVSLASLSLASCLGGQSGGEIETPPTDVIAAAACPCQFASRAVMVRGTVVSADACEVEVRADEILGGLVSPEVTAGARLSGMPVFCSDADLTEGEDVLALLEIPLAVAQPDPSLVDDAPVIDVAPQLFVRRWSDSYRFTEGGNESQIGADELALFTDSERCTDRLIPPETRGASEQDLFEGAPPPGEPADPITPETDPGGEGEDLGPVSGPVGDDDETPVDPDETPVDPDETPVDPEGAPVDIDDPVDSAGGCSR